MGSRFLVSRYFEGQVSVFLCPLKDAKCTRNGFCGVLMTEITGGKNLDYGILKYATVWDGQPQRRTFDLRPADLRPEISDVEHRLFLLFEETGGGGFKVDPDGGALLNVEVFEGFVGDDGGDGDADVGGDFHA